MSRIFRFHSNRTRKTGTLPEDQYAFLIICRTTLFRTRNTYAKLVEKITIRFMFHKVFFFKSCLLRDNVEKYCTAGQATVDNMVHAHCMLDNEVYKHSFRICNNYIGGADKPLAGPTCRRILFDGENSSFDASLVLYIYIYINSNNIPPIMIISRIYEHQSLLSL
jgi:hypothetical protein